MSGSRTTTTEKQKVGPAGISSPPFVRFLQPLASLGVRDFRIYWVSMMGQWCAMNMQMLARGWFMYELTDSALLLGLVGTTMSFPMLLFSLFGGTLADRMDKRTLLVVGQGAAALGSLAIGLDITLGTIVWWHLILASLFQGTVMAISLPSRQAVIPQLVPKKDMLNAVSLSAAGQNLARLMAPALAGFLVLWIQVEGVYYVMTALYLMSALTMLLLPHIESLNNTGNSVRKDMAEGLRYLKENSVVMVLLLVAFVATMFGMPLQFLLPVFTEDVLQVGPEALGVLLSMAGLGAVAGSVFTAALGDFRRKGALLLGVVLVFGLGIVAFTMANSYLMALLLIVPVGLGQSGQWAVNSALVLSYSDPRIRGRVMSFQMMTFGLFPLGILPMGAAVEVLGPRWALGAGGAVVVLFALYLILFNKKIRRLE